MALRSQSTPRRGEAAFPHPGGAGTGGDPAPLGPGAASRPPLPPGLPGELGKSWCGRMRASPRVAVRAVRGCVRAPARPFGCVLCAESRGAREKQSSCDALRGCHPPDPNTPQPLAAPQSPQPRRSGRGSVWPVTAGRLQRGPGDGNRRGRSPGAHAEPAGAVTGSLLQFCLQLHKQLKKPKPKHGSETGRQPRITHKNNGALIALVSLLHCFIQTQENHRKEREKE